MQDADAVGYLTRKGFERKRTEHWDVGGTQAVFDCVFCGAKTTGEKRRMYVSESTGQFKTFCCDRVGNLWTLRRHFGDARVKLIAGAGGVDPNAQGLGQRILATRNAAKRAPALALVEGQKLPDVGSDEKYHAALMASSAPVAWLKERGFTLETISRCLFGLRVGDDGREWITIPQYLPDGRLSGFKYRILPWHMVGDRRFAREPGCPTVLYGAHRLGSETAVTVYEAELDAASGDQIGVPLGLSSTAGAKTWLPEWTTILAGVDTIYLAHDADSDGEKGAAKVAEALGFWRCRRVAIPQVEVTLPDGSTVVTHDMNDCLRYGLHQEVREAFAVARPLENPLIVRPSKYGTNLSGLSKLATVGDTTGIKLLDALIGGRRGGELTVVSGHSGNGKTTATTFLAWSAASLGVPALIGSFEHPPEDESLKLATMEAGSWFLDMATSDREAVVARLHRKPVYLIDAYGSLSWATIWDTLRYFYYACGGRVAVIDHLDYVVDAGDDKRRARHEIIDDFVMQLMRMLKQELRHLHVYLVVHPKVEQRDKSGAMPDVTKDSLRGGGSVKQKPDNVLIVKKSVRLDGQKRSIWTMDKVRHICGQEGQIILEFDPVSLRFVEPPAPAPAAVPAPAPAAPNAAPATAAAPKARRQRKIKDRQKLAANDREDEDDDG